MSEKLYIVLPAYNEEENIEAVIKDWYPILDGKDDSSQIIVADSGSTDSTHEILENLQKDFPKLQILSNTGKFHGPKVIALYDYAIKNNADWIFQTDSDGQTNPEEFYTFWNMRNEYDGIFGNRTIRGDGKHRAFVEKVVCFLIKLYFGVNIPDANAPFRLMKTDVVKKYLYRLEADYNLPNIMITTYFSFYNEKYFFQKISFKPRGGGENSINIPKIIKIGFNALGDFSKLKKGL